jgi:thiamine-monophosphate kinase
MVPPLLLSAGVQTGARAARWTPAARAAHNGDVVTVSEIGELGLISRLSKQVEAARLQPPAIEGFELKVGIGDDAAVWTVSGTEVSTTDTMVEGVHFTRQTVPWVDLGWRAFAANLSDIAAMGAVPTVGIVTLGLPRDLPVEAVDQLYDGMLEACRCYVTLIVGGDIVSSRDVFVTIAMQGVCDGEPLMRSAARVGDAIAVSGTLGGSRAGLELLNSGLSGPEPLVRAHRRPEPRIAEGKSIANAGIRCAMDVSDGLAVDLGKLAEASGVGAHVQAALVPLAPGLVETFPEQALEFALTGGEDYELLFVGPRELIDGIRGAVVIGEITAGGGVSIVDAAGDEMTLADAGWDHLR